MENSRWILRVLDIQGKTLSITQLEQDGSSIYELSTAKLPPVIYIVALQSQDEILVSKFMKH